MADFIRWNPERNRVNQKERTITIFLIFGEDVDLSYDYPLSRSFIFQKRLGTSPNFEWVDFEDNEVAEQWKFQIIGSNRSWYIIAKPKEDDNEYEGFYRFHFEEDKFGNNNPDDNLNFPPQDEQEEYALELISRNKIENETLYMTGLTNNTIYTLNPNTGKATRIGNLTNFTRESQEENEKVNQIFPQDLQLIESGESDEPAIHMLGVAPSGLFLVDFLERSNTRGEARKLSDSPDSFNIEGLSNIEGFAASETEIWLGADQVLYSINPEAFVGTKINDLFLNTDGLAYGSFDPLIDKKLYRIGAISNSDSNRKLSSIDLDTGTIDFGLSTDSNIRSMTFVENELYALKQDGVYRIESNGNSIELDRTYRNLTIEVSKELRASDNEVVTVIDEETDPRGIASDGTVLYLIGQSTKALYSIDIEDNLAPKDNPGEPDVYPTRGLATKIADLDLDGIEDNQIDGLFYFTGDLYTYGTTSKRLWKINIFNGRLIQPDTSGFGISGLALTGLTERNGQLFAVGILEDTGQLFRIDKTTGIIDNQLFEKNFGPVNQTLPTALEYVSGSSSVCYMVGVSHNNQLGRAALYTLDLDTGIASKIGSNNIINFGVGENSPTGLAHIPGTENNGKGTLYMVGSRTAKLYTLDIDETSDSYGTATAVDSSVLGFGVNELAPQGLTYIESRTRVFISEPEEFVGVPAPRKLFGNKVPVVRKNKFYLDVTWSKDIDENNFQSKDIIPTRLRDGFEANVENIGTEGTSYQFRIEIIIKYINTGEKILSVGILIPPVEGSPQIIKNIEFDLDIPTYDDYDIGSSTTWRIYNEGENEGSGSWEKIGNQIRTLSPTTLRVDLDHSSTLPEPEDFYIEVLSGNERYKDSNGILSVSGNKDQPRLKIQLPLNTEGFLRVGIKADTLVNERGVLGPISNPIKYDSDTGRFEKRYLTSPYFQFDTTTN